MLKKGLKKIVPVKWLDKAHTRYNTLRINTIDKVLFPEKQFTGHDFIIKRDDYPFRLTTVHKDHLHVRLQLEICLYENWTQDEYLLVYEDECIIEPRYGWALTAEKQLIYPSLGFSRASYLQKPSTDVLRLSIEKLPLHDVLVSLRDTGENNYYHFYNDVLAKLFFLEEKINLSSDVPLLITEALYNKPFFQYFLQHPYLKNRTWILQKPGEYVRSKKTYFCKPLTHTESYYDRIKRLVPSQEILPRTSGFKKIFITRSPKRVRFIENSSEIEKICRAEGFEIVDFDTMTIDQQIRAMVDARYVAGIHGAGLVNMLFHGKRPMGLLELFPPGEFYPFHYMLMAAQLGYAYDGMVGEPGRNKQASGFYLDPTTFHQHLLALLAQA